MGAPPSNTNAQRHGRSSIERAARAGYRDRRYPKGVKYSADEASRYATALYADVKDVHNGNVSRPQLEAVEAMAAWHLFQLVTLKIMRDDAKRDQPELSAEARIRMWSEIAKAADKKAERAKQLGLELPDASPYAASRDDFQRELARQRERLTLEAQACTSQPAAVATDEQAASAQEATDAATEPQEPA